MTRVTISAPPGKPDNVTVSVDECPIPGILRYRLEQEAGKLAVLSLDIAMRSGDVHLPDVVVRALDSTPDELRDAAADTAHPALDEFARVQREAYPELERRAIAGTQLEGVDVVRLAESWSGLDSATRALVLHQVRVSSDDGDPITHAFALVHAAGKLREFAAAVAAVREAASAHTMPTASEGAE